MADNYGVDLEELSEAEAVLWGAFPRGVWADLRTGNGGIDALAQAERWGAERTISADLITSLLLGAFDPEPGYFPAVRIRGARVTGQLDLMGATVGYALVCEGCWFEEPLRFVEATTKTVRIVRSYLPSINGARMRTEGILNLYGSVIGGLLRLDRAHIAGEVSLTGANVGDGTAEAIAAQGLAVDGDMLCNRGFAAHGSVNLRGARIAGRLSFRGAVLEVPESPLPEGTGLHLSLLHADELDLRTAQRINAGIRLRNAQVGTLDDDPAVWPANIWLNGFTYDSIRPGQGGLVPVAERLRWLERDTVGYRPQPYEQLAAFYRRNGQDDEARRVLLAKQRARRTTLRPAAKVSGLLLDWTVGYGYRPWLAAIWLAALLAVGTAVFTAHQPHPLTGGPVPPFNAFIYTVDLLIPIGAFGMRDAYAQTGPAQWVAYALIAAGWILATAVIAGVTRLVGRD